MRKRFLLVIALLAVSCLLAATAYTSATVTNASTINIKTTSEALLALEPSTGVGTNDGTCIEDGGELVFDFGKSGADSFGLQPNSVYEWAPLFMVTNKSADAINVTVEYTGEGKDYVTFGTYDSTNDVTTWGTAGSSLDVGTINSTSSENICVKIDVPSGTSLGQLSGSIVVSAEATTP